MTNTVISVEHLTKQYDLGVIGTGTISRDLNRWWARIRKQPDPYTRIGHQDPFARIGESILALNDVSFKVQQGEALGIIGRNGAGKSTLLKILSRVTAPTSGMVKVRGRIGSLLEVGTGFHPELTGRENVYLNGAILGMKKAEITRKFDEIVAFAGVEKFIDTPVKRYSSGMYVRLAFAVAAHLDPEILIVDEVLAVGDAEFQKKCLGKMGDVAGEGRTVLFVSHNMPSIVRLCPKAILLNNGRIKTEGSAAEVTNEYLRISTKVNSSRDWESLGNSPGDDVVRLRKVSVVNHLGEVTQSYLINKPVYVEMVYEVLEGDHILFPNIHITNDQGIKLFVSINNESQWKEKAKPIGLYKSTMEIPENFLSEGGILVSAAVTTFNPFKVHIHEQDIVTFQVVESMEGQSARGDYEGHLPGVVRPIFNWSTIVFPS